MKAAHKESIQSTKSYGESYLEIVKGLTEESKRFVRMKTNVLNSANNEVEHFWNHDVLIKVHEEDE